MTPVFETASFHIVKPCNFSCKYCYATFNDMRVPMLPIKQVEKILVMLRDAGVQKMTFAGGEPTMYPDLFRAIEFAKQLGYTTSIISNGSYMGERWLREYKEILDWVGISIDSLNSTVNHDIGRELPGMSPNAHFFVGLVKMIKHYGYKLKINTVVNRFNENESLQEFIDFANPDRWKIFDTLRIEGQNDKQFEKIRSTPGTNAFERFVDRHSHPNMVVENNEAMTGSYLLIDPQGRLFENSSGKHTYTAPLTEFNSVADCIANNKEIKFNRDMFLRRGGIYNW